MCWLGLLFFFLVKKEPERKVFFLTKSVVIFCLFSMGKAGDLFLVGTGGGSLRNRLSGDVLEALAEANECLECHAEEWFAGKLRTSNTTDLPQKVAFWKGDPRKFQGNPGW